MKEQEKEPLTKQELREKIIKQACESFEIYGIKGIRMDDIASSLRMSKRTLYEIFADKETLLRECILYNQAIMEETLKNAVDSSSNVMEAILKCYQATVEAYHRVNKGFFEDIKKYPKVHELVKRGKEQDVNVTIDFLKQGVEQGLFRDDINFALLQMIVREQMRELIARILTVEFDFLEVYESMMFIYLRGISTEKGAKELENYIKVYKLKK